MASSIPAIEDLVDPLQYDDQATLSTETDPLTSLSPNDFIVKFSKINIVDHSQPTANNVDRGGSREEPHRFKKPCPNAVNGCSKLLETDEQIRIHMLHCKLISIADHKAAELAAAKLTKSFICEVCGVGSSTKRSLQIHMLYHDESWVPKQGNVIGCRSKTYFKNENSWNAHHVSSHGSYTPLPCPVEDCKEAISGKLFLSRDSFKQHVGKHGIKGKDATKYFPRG